MKCHFCGKENVYIIPIDDPFKYKSVELISKSTLYDCPDCGKAYYNLFEEVKAEKKAIIDYLRKIGGIGSGATR